MNILITGSSGLIGTTLKHRLSTLGHRVFALVHTDNKASAKKDLTWSIKNDYVRFPPNFSVDIVIHLAGANIAKPWTPAHKKAIMESRDAGTQLLVREIIKQSIQPRLFISTSAIGLYPDPSAQITNEDGPIGSGFLSDVCQRWEAALTPLKAANIAVGIVRVGLVLSTDGGVYPVAAKTRKLGIVPVTGSYENQWSWIHIFDLVSIFIALAEEKLPIGTYNGVAPNAVSQREFANALIRQTKKARQLRLPIAFKPLIPAFLLRMVLGERSVLALTSQQIISTKLPVDMFEFKTIDAALEDLVHG